MDLPEIEARQNELDQLIDWLTDNDPLTYLTYLDYYHQRGIELDNERPGV